MKKNILIIDDERNIRIMLRDILQDEGFQTFEAGNWDEGYKVLISNKIDVILLDVCLPKVGGMEILDSVKRDFMNVEVIMISGHGTIDVAVKAIKQGAFDFIEKPLSIDRVLAVIQNGLKIKSLKEENEQLRATAFQDIQIVGKSKIIEGVKGQIESAAKSDARVLITGDNGSGKELVAKSIHLHSDRRTKPFIDINCAAIPENLIESELFGHEKGAFTGAIASKKGKFELANHGTIFLDEVADMSLNTQAKVLRVLQEMEFERVGGVSPIKVDVRVISATNKDILEEIETGGFREDLYYRLNVIPITMPPLRERKEDIPLLADFFLNQLASRSGNQIKTIPKESMKVLMEYNWNGNVRQLRNVIERLSILVEDEIISPDHIKKYVMEKERKSDLEDFSQYTSLKDAKDAFEKKYIHYKLQENEMNVTKTAKALDIERSHLHKKLKKYELA